MKKLIAVATIAMAGLSVGGSVFAGEVGGSTNGKANGPKATEGHAQSICAFSGLADGGEGEPSGPGNVQNWGHVDRSVEPSPGFACNGNHGFLSEP